MTTNIRFGSVLLALIFGAVVGVLGTELLWRSGNVSTPKEMTTNENVENSTELIEKLRAEYEAMLAERKAKVSQSVSKKEIVVFTLPNCPPCKDWIAFETKRFQDADWKVAVCDKPEHDYTRGPTFELTGNGKRVIVVGYISLDRAEAAIR